MLDETITWVRERKNSGASLDEILVEGLPTKFDGWGYGYMSAEGWITMIWNSLG